MPLVSLTANEDLTQCHPIDNTDAPPYPLNPLIFTSSDNAPTECAESVRNPRPGKRATRAKAPVPRDDGDRALYFSCGLDNRPPEDFGIQRGLPCPPRCNAPTASRLPLSTWAPRNSSEKSPVSRCQTEPPRLHCIGASFRNPTGSRVPVCPRPIEFGKGQKSLPRRSPQAQIVGDGQQRLAEGIPREGASAQMVRIAP